MPPTALPCTARVGPTVEVAVVDVVDEKLRRARVRSARCKSHVSALVAHAARLVVHDAVRAPLARDGGVAREPELNHETGHDAEEARVVVEPLVDELAEARAADRRPEVARAHDEATGPVLRDHIEPDADVGARALREQEQQPADEPKNHLKAFVYF
jgi:hypothetical protein